MKFKTKEDLEIPDTGNNRWEYNKGVSDAFKSFAERVELFKRYRMEHTLVYDCKEGYSSYKTHLDAMKRECPKLFNKFLEDCSPEKHRHLNTWNDWLFDYCFGGILDDTSI